MNLWRFFDILQHDFFFLTFLSYYSMTFFWQTNLWLFSTCFTDFILLFLTYCTMTFLMLFFNMLYYTLFYLFFQRAILWLLNFFSTCYTMTFFDIQYYDFFTFLFNDYFFFYILYNGFSWLFSTMSKRIYSILCRKKWKKIHSMLKKKSSYSMSKKVKQVIV